MWAEGTWSNLPEPAPVMMAVLPETEKGVAMVKSGNIEIVGLQIHPLPTRIKILSSYNG
jgi:hypothetical protein